MHVNKPDAETLARDVCHYPNRREFVARAGLVPLLGVGAVLRPRPRPPIAPADDASERSAEDWARDETFWYQVQQSYVQSSGFINLESGYYSPAPRPVLDAECRQLRRVNEIPSFFMRRHQDAEKQRLRRQVAEFAGAGEDEIVITRNTTESLNTIIAGLQLDNDAEALMSDQEYPSMLQAFEQRHARYGLKYDVISIPTVPEDPGEVVQSYVRAITPKTKILLVSHMVFRTGQVLPVRQICDMAHARGIEVIVDAAHSFAHLSENIADLNCDYLGCSLHKWLGAPLGTGLMYIKKEKIAKVWPLYGDRDFAATDIRKFEHIGTHPVPIALTIADAIRFHQAIGSKPKEARLRYLKDYWVRQVEGLPGVTVNTPLNGRQSCAIANVALHGHRPASVANQLYDRYGIFVVAVENGIRVAPNLWTRPAELDRLVTAIKELAA